MERVSRIHRKKSRYQLAIYLRNYLNNRYKDVLWVVVVYDDVQGWDAHTVIGSVYYHRFRHYGHNIVVSRIVHPYGTKAPVDIAGKFNRAFTPSWKKVCSNSWCWSKKNRINAKSTVQATWNKLYNEGLQPIMLHVFRGGIDGAVATNRNPRVCHQQMPDGGVRTLLAVAR